MDVFVIIVLHIHLDVYLMEHELSHSITMAVLAIYAPKQSIKINNDLNLLRGTHRPPTTRMGPCTNHVDRILGNFDPPPPYVDTFIK